MIVVRYLVSVVLIATLTACVGRDQLVSTEVLAEPDPTSNILPIEVTFQECANGVTPERIEEIRVEETDTEVRVQVLAWLPVPWDGVMTCPSNGWLPLTVELEEPLGDRSLFVHDGERFYEVPPAD